MTNAICRLPEPTNEPVLEYRPGSPERADLKLNIADMSSTEVEVPAVIGGKKVYSGDCKEIRMPHKHSRRLGLYHSVRQEDVGDAIAAAMGAKEEWARTPWEERAAIFLRAAEILAGRYRQILNASTMLGQSKTAHQAEVDSACELIDFFRFNVCFMEQIYRDQPRSSTGIWNRLEHRPLEGFVFAVTPFNFTSIAGNLPSAPAIMGNTVLWKPARSAVFSAHIIMELFQEAGLPPGVINLLPGSPAVMTDRVVGDPNFAGIHFTGSTGVFQSLWKQIGQNIANYRTYPRLVGETGGKDFVFAHCSADLEELATALIRGAFEYQGQKCSAASRAYLPASLWRQLKELLVAQIAQIRMGDVADFRNFMGAVIDEKAFDKIAAYIDFGHESATAEILSGGKYDKSEGYFIPPTLVQVTDPAHKLMVEEIFGPILTVYVYPDDKFQETLDICDQGSPYALTGAVFARDRRAVIQAANSLRNAAGNFYVNDKPTGAVVGQQPFGGARASGTNDKAGSYLNLLRWVSPQSIKETFCPPRKFDYPFMAEE